MAQKGPAAERPGEMAEEGLSHEVLMRIKVYRDDREMQVIYDHFLRVREESRSRRGRARRGVESEFIRRLMIAGYRHLYGEFPRPGAEGLPSPLPTSHREPPMTGEDIETKVATVEPRGSNAQAESPAPPPAASPAGEKPRVDLSNLLHGGGSTR